MSGSDDQGGLEAVARLKAEAERSAALALAAAERKLAEEEARLTSLREMAEQYASRWSFTGGDLQRLRDTRSFIAQLQAGVQAQTAAVEQQRRITEAARAHWVAARLQREALDKVLEERAAAESRLAERREQRLVDDRSAQASRFVPAHD
ncbi:MAG TPA: flagellar export protein FliJ [Gammaproteobacteria bacterium]